MKVLISTEMISAVMTMPGSSRRNDFLCGRGSEVAAGRGTGDVARGGAAAGMSSSGGGVASEDRASSSVVIERVPPSWAGSPHTYQAIAHAQRSRAYVPRRRHARSATGDRVATLLDLGSLAAQVAEVVELCAAHVTAGHDLDLVDDRRVHREGALDPDAEADLAHGERLTDAVALTPDGDALEDLDARASALDDLDVDLERVARAEMRDVGAQGGGIDGVEDLHRDLFLAVPQVTHERRGGVCRVPGPFG